MSDEEEWKARILVNMNWSSPVENLNQRTSKLIFLIQEKLSEEKLALPFDGALYYPPDDLHSLSKKELASEVKAFEKFACIVGIEGKCMAIWVDPDDEDMEDEMVEKLRLKERNCEWLWDFASCGSNEAVYPRICKFFEDKTQQCQVKPAKR